MKAARIVLTKRIFVSPEIYLKTLDYERARLNEILILKVARITDIVSSSKQEWCVMNFIEAMQHVAENERTAVILPGADAFVWYDGQVRHRGQPPAGLLVQRIGRGQSSQPYAPALKDVMSEDWEVYEPANIMRL